MNNNYYTEMNTNYQDNPYVYPGDNTPQPDIPEYLVGTFACEKCGVSLEGSVSYYCARNDCQVYAKATY